MCIETLPLKRFGIVRWRRALIAFAGILPERVKGFHFADGAAFDFRGAKLYSIGGSEETLSDSNERASKGFVSTLELQGKITIQLKLDWIFVRPPNLIISSSLVS
jgi:hypothetical protein